MVNKLYNHNRLKAASAKNKSDHSRVALPNAAPSEAEGRTAPVDVNEPATVTAPKNADVDPAALAPPVIVITSAKAPVAVVATWKANLPDSDPEVAAFADAVILAKS